LAVACEAISSERDRKRSQAHIMRLIGEAVVSRRDEPWQRAGTQQILVRIIRCFEREQHSGKASPGSWQQQMSTSARFETRGIRKSAAGRIERGPHLGPGCGRNE